MIKSGFYWVKRKQTDDWRPAQLIDCPKCRRGWHYIDSRIGNDPPAIVGTQIKPPRSNNLSRAIKSRKTEVDAQ